MKINLLNVTKVILLILFSLLFHQVVYGQEMKLHPLLKEIQISNEDLPAGFKLDSSWASMQDNNTATLAQTWNMLDERSEKKCFFEIYYCLYPTAEEASQAANKWIRGLSVAPFLIKKIQAPEMGDEVWEIRNSAYPSYIRKGRIFIKNIIITQERFDTKKNKWVSSSEINLPIKNILMNTNNRIKAAGLDK